MTAISPALRTLAFGDVARTVWGTAWMPGSDGSALTTLGADGLATVVSTLRLSADQDGDNWRLEGDRAALTVTPAGEVVAVHATDDAVEGFDQLCRVTGQFEVDGAEQAVDCLGLRASRSGGFDMAKLESVRAVSTWFEPDEGLAVMAFRGRKAKHHDADVVTAAVLGPEPCAPIEDPRLSTTYDAGGWPIRAGLELWLAGEGEGEGEEEQYPRRAVGEAVGARVEAVAGELDLRAEPFRWHSRGREGAGMYILARRR
jgi:hypothetical protein